MESFLEEVEASVLVADAHDFQALAEQLNPVELGLGLDRFYGYLGGIVERHGGRIVKFTGDGMLVAFLGADHCGEALAALEEMARTRAGWLADSAKVHAPSLDYSAGVAS